MSLQDIRVQFENQMKFLGIFPGDILLLRADLSTLFSHSFRLKKQDYLSFFLSYLGVEGTLVALAFNPVVRSGPLPVYTKNTQPYTGSLAKIMLEDPRSVRSEHPLESFVAIGKYASFLMEGHSSLTHSFFPMEKMIHLDAKMLVVGCTMGSPGFTTVHYVQHCLGLSKQVLCPDSDKAEYIGEDGCKVVYTSKEIGGCSRGFYKFYPFYIQNNILKAGFLGEAYSLGIGMKAAVDIETSLLSLDSSVFCCDDPVCWFCAKRYVPNLSKRSFSYWMFYLSKMLQVMRCGN